MHIDDLDTPVAVVDIDRMEANIAGLQSYLTAHSIANRPHIKTHKIPAIAQLQMAAGAAGITCQKLGEAEIMAAAGLRDIFISYNIVGAARLARLVRLAHQVTVSVAADSGEVVTGLGTAARGEGLTLPVLVECDTGMGRCGVQSPQAAHELGRRIAATLGLRFAGLMTYPTSEATDPFMAEARALLAAEGIPVERVSSGGTARMWQAHLSREVNEYRAGMYIFGDRYTILDGAMSVADCALHVIATVVSRPTANRAIIDAGSKTLSSDRARVDGHGLILEYPAARIYTLSEEHGHVDFSACPARPAIGERVTIIPNHCCVVVNLCNELVGARQGQVEVVWPVAARGAVT